MCCSDVMVTSIKTDITYETLLKEMKDICKFDSDQPFTMKWVDEEGKPKYSLNYDFLYYIYNIKYCISEAVLLLSARGC